MSRRSHHRCSSCGGTEFVPAVDDHGQPYEGCVRCVIGEPRMMPAKAPEIAEAERRGARSMVLYLLSAGAIDREQAEVARRAIEAGWVRFEEKI